MRWRRLAARVCATETDSTKPINEISAADPINACQRAASNCGTVRLGRPDGTVPTSATPAAARSNFHATQVVTTMASTGPVLAKGPIRPFGSPIRRSSGARPLRTQTRNVVVPTPIANVGRFNVPMLSKKLTTISSNVWPSRETPARCFNWLAAIRMPDAVINPDMTGWLRKLAITPKRSTPMTKSIAPDSSASTAAAATNCAGSLRPSRASAAAVISETMATGPTDSVRLDPKIA